MALILRKTCEHALIEMMSCNWILKAVQFGVDKSQESSNGGVGSGELEGIARSA